MLRTLTIGDDSVDFKGTEYWVKTLERYEEKLSFLVKVYTDKLDEKRNFWSFLLTVVSIVQFPMEAITCKEFEIEVHSNVIIVIFTNMIIIIFFDFSILWVEF